MCRRAISIIALSKSARWTIRAATKMNLTIEGFGAF
jgi:hypothetical protein